MTLYWALALGTFVYLITKPRAGLSRQSNTAGSIILACLWPMMPIISVWFSIKALMGWAVLEVESPKGQVVFGTELMVFLVLTGGLIWIMGEPGSIMQIRLF